MSIYIVILILLLTSVIIPKLTGVNVNVFYYPLFLALTFFLCFRYGQGTDYFNYKSLYESSLSNLTWNDYSTYLLLSSHGEIGWNTIFFIFNILHINYEYFVVFLSLLEMLLLNNFIKNYCSNDKCLALLLLYPTIYLTYLFSVSRQGLVICIFLGIMLDLLNNNKILSYSLFCLVCMTLHSSAFVLFALIYVVKIKEINIYYGILTAFIFGLIFYIGPIKSLLSKYLIFTGASIYIETSDLYGFAIILRIIMLLIVLILYDKNEKTGLIKQQLILLNSFKIYLSGTIIYFAFFSMALIASRLSIYFLAVDIILFVNLIPKSMRYGSLIFCIIILFTVSMTVKNINSYIVQGSYHENIKVWNYPYSTLFDKNRIFEYRDVYNSFKGN